MNKHGVSSLLMGGQACVFYGAAEFSRDVDFAIYAEPDNLNRLQSALDELQASVIAIPPFQAEVLGRGHAVHFRCQAPGVEGLRVDVMTTMRGVDPFPILWERRTVLEIESLEVDLMSLPDLVRAKKTQRDKDWPMIQRLIEAHWFTHKKEPTPVRVSFWLRECRTPEILLELVAEYPDEANRLKTERPVLDAAMKNDSRALVNSLEAERLLEVAADQAYWSPLRKELESMRKEKRKAQF